jgi:hypothetical protein
MHLPQGIAGWGVFATGLVVIAYRIHGIDAPRAWIEWVERRFVYATNVRAVGLVFLVIAALLGYFGKPVGAIAPFFRASVALLSLVALLLIVLQNHARHIALATAEASDAKIRIGSVIVTLLGLGLALCAFFV